jgi:L-asparagine transporter-like permease
MSRLAANVVLRILLFYILSILLVLCIVPWSEFKQGDSTFAIALDRIGIPGAATIMNVIVLTAVLSCLNSGVYVTARVLFAMADKGDAPRWLTATNKRQVPARAILLGSALGFVVMLLKQDKTEALFDFLMNSSGALMMFTYIFVALAHFRFPYSKPELRTAGGALYIAGFAALAMLAVMIAMSFMPNKRPEVQASFACLVAIVIALFIKRAVQKPA